MTIYISGDTHGIWDVNKLKELNATKDDYIIICGDCGEIFGSKVWHSNSKYRRTIWRCNAKYENGDPCSTPHLYEEDLKQYFITALSELLADRTALLEDGRLIR